MDLDAQAVRRSLRLADEERGWLAGLEELGPAPDPVELPRGEAAYALLRRLEVPGRDAEEIVAAAPDPGRDAALWWLLERVQHTIVRGMGGLSERLYAGPRLDYELGDAARYFHVYVFLAALPHTRRFHEKLGIPDEVARATLAQLGEMVAIHRRKYGSGGMDTQFWLTLHLRGVIYRLGRLQFNLEERGGEPVLGTHIPETGGAMTPEACDESFRRARPFFDGYFPSHGAELAVCTSWLLDPQLADHLPEASNIVRFMRRWTLFDEEHRLGDESVLEFVFRRNRQALDELPQRSSLERAVVRHLRAGGHWYTPTGWIKLP